LAEKAVGAPANSQRGFVAANENVLEVYSRPHDVAPPVVCFEKAEND
jgi:hypothetical protein